jgi:DNA-binding Lrp family transcriptional regulator
MPLAYVLLRVEVGAESEVLETLRKADAVEEAHRIYGIYDAVAKIRADTMDKLKEIVTYKVRRIDKVQSTITLLVIE